MTITLRPHQQQGLDAMVENSIGQIIMPTGSGKTLTMIFDAIRQFKNHQSQTIVVVCPRILLAEQLSSEFLEHIVDVDVMHVHSGDTHHFSTTKPSVIRMWSENVGENQLIFTTYNSLCKVQESDIKVDTIYFDEAHHSVKRNFFGPTEYFSYHSKRIFYFTATRRTSTTITKPGMNVREVYGDIIYRVPAPYLVERGYILPPKVKIIEMEKVEKSFITPELERNNILATVDGLTINKVLVCAKTTKQLINVFKTDFAQQLKDRGYSYLYITSKTGAVIDGIKVGREEFFNTLNAWGKDSSKKFVVLHRSICSEGISINGLEGVIFMRNMNSIEMVQSIGRVLRLAENKTCGMVACPVYDNVGIATAKSLETCIDIVFEKGELYDSVVRK